MVSDLLRLFLFAIRVGYPRALAPLPIWRSFEYATALKWLALQRGMQVLDVGTGRSCFSLYLWYRYGVDVTCIDLDKTVATAQAAYINRLGKRNKPDARYVFNFGDVTNLNFENDGFDRIICISVIEHIKRDTRAVEEMLRVLKRGGYLYMTTAYADFFREYFGIDRWYDLPSIHARLLPQNVFLVRKEIFYDRIPYRYRSFLPLLLSWAGPLSSMFMTKSPTPSKQGIICLLLRKS